MSRVLEPLPWLAAAGTLWALTLATLGVAWFVRPIRAWATLVDLRWLVLVHLSRLVGIWFLVLHGRGRLPYEFAVWGGWGDIGAAAGALIILLAARPPMGRRGRTAVLLWNIAGLIDILFVVVTAARSGTTSPGSMAELQRMPLSLLVTFIVPLIIATHAVMIARLSKGGS